MRRARSFIIFVAVLTAGAMVATACGPPTPRSPNPLFDPAVASVRPIEGRPARVLIVGDSIADQHGSHATYALREMGIQVRYAGFWGWSFFSREQYDFGQSVANPPDGTLMRSAMDAAADFDPDVVVLYSNHNYWSPFPRDAAGNTIQMGTPAFDEMALEQLTLFMSSMTSRGAVVYLIKPVPAAPGHTAMDNKIWTSYLAARDELGFGIINTGDIVAAADGKHVQQLGDCAGALRDVRPPNDLHLTYFGAGLTGTVTARAAAALTNTPTNGSSAPAEAPAALVRATPGYRVVSCDGASFQFGDTSGIGIGGHALGATRAAIDPVVAAANGGPADQAWALTAAGKILPLGGATHLGDATGLSGVNKAVGIAPTASYGGYWIATSQGQVQAFGNATSLGDLAGQGHTVVAMGATRDRRGYWLLTSAGRVFAFGTATHLGDLAASPPDAPVVALAGHPQADGYWILDRAGNTYPFGAAVQHGSAADQPMRRVIGFDPQTGWQTEEVPASEVPTHTAALLPTPTGNGYWIALGNGAVCHFGAATASGGIHRAQVNGVMTFFGLEFYPEGPCSQGTEPALEAAQEALEAMTGTDLGDLADVPAGEVPGDISADDDPPLDAATG